MSKEVSNKTSPAFTLTEGNVCANKIYSLLFKQQQPTDEKFRKIQSVARQMKIKNKLLQEKSENALQSDKVNVLDLEQAKAVMIGCLTETKTVDEHFVEMMNSVEKLFTSLNTFLRKQLTLYRIKKEFTLMAQMLSEGDI